MISLLLNMYIYFFQTPTPSVTSAADPTDVDMQIHGNPMSHDNNAPTVNRLASIRLHQALIQSHDKQWTNHNNVSTYVFILLQLYSKIIYKIAILVQIAFM